MIETKSVLICKKCKEKGDYLFPIISIKNDETIIYKCLKCNSEEKNNFYEIFFNDKLKHLLNECKTHEGNVFVGWCKDCKKNLCYLCIGEELRKNHDYNLNANINQDRLIFLNDNLQIMKGYEKIFQQYEKELNYFEYCFYIYEKLKIINYQTQQNTYYFFEKMIKIYNNYINMKEQEKKDYISFIKGKNIENIQQKSITVDNIKILKIIPLNCSFINKSIVENKKIILIYNIGNEDFEFRDINGNLINKINIERYWPFPSIFSFFYKFYIIQFEPNILFLFKDEMFSFLRFNSSFDEFELTDIAGIKKPDDRNIINTIIKDKPLEPFLSFKYDNKIFKIINDAIILLYSGKLYYIKSKEKLSFNTKIKTNKEKSEGEEIKRLTLNKDLNYTILTKPLFRNHLINIAPIYSTDNNKSIKKIVTVSLESIFDFILHPFNNDIYLKTDIYNYLYGMTFIDNATNILNNENKTNSIKEGLLKGTLDIKFYLDIRIYTFIDTYITLKDNLDNLMKLSNYFAIKISKEDVVKWMNQVSYFDIVYNYSNEHLLFFFFDKIYQYNLKYGEMTTIHDLGIIGMNFNLTNISVIHYFKTDLSKMKELILLINSSNNVYPYEWDQNNLKPIEKFEFQKYNNIIEFNFFDFTDDKLLNSMDLERISINGNKITIFK